MKRAVLLHGTDGSPEYHWFPWLRNQLKQSGYEVFAPLLPDNHRPNRHTYEQFLKASDWDFTDNILVGHSSGATTVLNLLSLDWFPRVRAVVLVGTFLNEKLVKDIDGFEDDQFEQLFLPDYDPERIKSKSNHFIFVHGSDDPYCDIDDARALCEKLGGTFIIIENGKHLNRATGITELPEIMEALEEAL